MAAEKKVACVCQGTGCASVGSPEIQAALQEEVARLGLTDQVEVKRTGCHGFCQQGPLVVVEPEGVFYRGVALADAPEIAASLAEGEKPVERLAYRDPKSGDPIPRFRDITFYSRQQRNVLRHCGHIDPEDVDEYVAVGGYAALRRALLEMTPDQVIAELQESGLRGRGGAGFPTGQKWSLVSRAAGDRKHVVCNADEGDPGAFQDRSLLEGDPHSMLEGMILAAYAVGASDGYAYVRAEYPLAVRRLRRAIEQARERGFLGEGILDTPFSFDVEIIQGAGAFVCGEETALIRSVEGMRGMPSSRPPYPAVSGLWGEPTLINNVKTFASARWILANGAAAYAAIGTPKSRGTAIFSLTGKVANCGLIEVPMGITLREIIFDIGGGVPGGKAFKAVQTGGPSGGCLPASLLDTPVDFDSLTAAGAIMGSGGMVVMDEETCMVDVARYFQDFTQKESCGKCSTCRLGTLQMLRILEDITQGRGRPEDIDLLMELGEAVKLGSLCGLGRTAPNPVLTTIRYFRDEYEAHIGERKCPALVCKPLISYHIRQEKCIGCTLCARDCPVGAITGARKEPHAIDQEKCTRCGACLSVCPKRADAVECVAGRLS